MAHIGFKPYKGVYLNSCSKYVSGGLYSFKPYKGVYLNPILDEAISNPPTRFKPYKGVYLN